MHEMTFNQLEKKLRAKWVKDGAKVPESALSLEDFGGIIEIDREEVGKILEEKTFFEDAQDVAANRHMRYFPPILHKHHFFEAACVVAGSCTNFINGKRLELKQGDICIFAPNTVHAIAAFCDDADIRNIMIKKSTFETSFMSLMKHNDILSDFFRRTFFSELNETPWILFHTAGDEEIATLVERIYTESAQNRAYKKRMLSALVSMFFISLLRKHEKDVVIPVLQNTPIENNFVFMMMYMQEHFAHISLGELAALFHYSPRQIQRIIKNATGMSFIENIQKLKMENAAHLLKNTTKSVAEIAEETGYESLNNFRAIFRRTYGHSPHEWRKLVLA